MGSKSKRKNGSKTTSIVPRVKEVVQEPFALVFYNAYGSTGVVLREQLPKTAVVGGSCMAPDPIHTEEVQNSNTGPENVKKYSATVVAFGYATIQGCLWHLCRAFVKKANGLRILRYRQAVPEILEFIRKACVISLLPEELFDEALEVLKRRARQVNQIAAYLVWHFFDYVETQWLGRAYRRNYMNFWRCVHRTNNSCESHNQMLRKAVGAYRPNVYAFIEALSRLEHNAYLDYNHMREGGEARATRRWKCVYTDRRIAALSTDLEQDIFYNREETIWNFLDQASRLIEGAMNDHVQREVAARRRRPAQ